MKKIKSTVINGLLVASVGFSISACTSATPDRLLRQEVPVYASSPYNEVALKRIEAKMNVGKFTSYNKDLRPTCRLGGSYIAVRDGASLDNYIEEAFKEELKSAGKYDEKSKITISGHIKKYTVSSSLRNAYWKISIDVISSNGEQFNVVHTTKYNASFMGSYACAEDMPNAFKKTVQELILAIIVDKRFKTLLK